MLDEDHEIFSLAKVDLVTNEVEPLDEGVGKLWSTCIHAFEAFVGLIELR